MAKDLDPEELRRVARQLNLPGFGMAQAQALAEARVLVVGAGGLGCPAMQTLVATGVGHIRLYDDDVVSYSNLHRQILFGVPDVGRGKAEAAAEKLRSLQPAVSVEARAERLTADNIIDALEGIDLVVDGSDTFATKYLVADACEITSTPLVWGTVLRYVGQIALFGGSATAPSLRDVFPEQPAADSVPDCATAGVLGVTTSVVGSLMATEAIKYLTGLGESMPGRLLSYDALAASLTAFQVRRDPTRPAVTSLGDYGATESFEAERLLQAIADGDMRALDVREDHEKLLVDLPGGADLHLPLSRLTEESLREALAGVTGPVVVYCASGKRSGGVVDKHTINGVELINLPGGIGSG